MKNGIGNYFCINTTQNGPTIATPYAILDCTLQLDHLTDSSGKGNTGVEPVPISHNGWAGRRRRDYSRFIALKHKGVK